SFHQAEPELFRKQVCKELSRLESQSADYADFYRRKVSIGLEKYVERSVEHEREARNKFAQWLLPYCRGCASVSQQGLEIVIREYGERLPLETILSLAIASGDPD